MCDESVAVERNEKPDQNLEDEIEEEEETELAIIEMEEQCNKEEGIRNENNVYSSLEDANRVRIEASSHTFVGRSRYSDKGLLWWNDLQEKIKDDLDSVETQGTVPYYQALLKIVQYTEDIKRSAEVIFDSIASIAKFHNDEKAQAIFKYSKKSFQRQADRLCAFYKLPKDKNSLFGEEELGGEEEIKEEEDEEEGNMEMEAGLIEEYKEEEEEGDEEMKEEYNEEDNTLIQANQSGSILEMTDQNDVPSSSTSSTSIITPIIINTPSQMDVITKTAIPSLPPPQSALLAALTSPSLPHLFSSESSPSLHNSRPPSDPTPSAIHNQSIIVATSPLSHSATSPSLPPNVSHSSSNSVAGLSTPSITAHTSSPQPHSNQSRIYSFSSPIPPSPVVAPSSRPSSSLPGSPPIKRVRVDAASSDSIESTTPSKNRPVQIRMSPNSKVPTPASAGHSNTLATSRLPQSMPFTSDYAQKAVWFHQVMMSQGMSQFPSMSPHQVMHFHPGMMMQRKMGVLNEAPQQPSTPRQTNTPQTANRSSPDNQSTSSPIQKQMQNEMIQRIMCGQNAANPMISPSPQMNGEHEGRHMMMMMPNGHQLTMQQMQQQQYYQAMIAHQMQFIHQNRPQ